MVISMSIISILIFLCTGSMHCVRESEGKRCYRFVSKYFYGMLQMWNLCLHWSPLHTHWRSPITWCRSYLSCHYQSDNGKSTSSTSDHRPVQDDPGPVQGFFLLKGSFSLPLLLVGGLALGFCKAPRDIFECNKCYINKDELKLITSQSYFQKTWQPISLLH